MNSQEIETGNRLRMLAEEAEARLATAAPANVDRLLFDYIQKREAYSDFLAKRT